MASDDVAFALGVVVSEGSFQIKMMKTGNNAGYTFSPSFSIHMNEREEGLLQNIETVFPVDFTVHERGDSISLYVGSKENVSELIEWIESQELDIFNQTVKASSMQTVKTIVDKLNAGEHKTPEGTIEIAQLRNEMNEAGESNRVDISEVREVVGQKA